MNRKADLEITPGLGPTINYKMNSINWKVKVISIFCQAYFALFSTVTLIILLNVTIPTVCVTNEGNMQTESYTPITGAITSRHSQLNFVALFVFCNTVGNYMCLRYKARLSSFTCHSSLDTSTTNSSNAGIGKDTNITVARQMDYVDNDMKNHSDAYKINETDFVGVYITSDNSTNPHLTSFNNNEVMETYKQKAERQFLIEKTTGPRVSKQWQPYFAQENTEKVCHDKNMNSFFQYSTSDWHLCRDCNMMAPPRAKHCPLCHYCVLKRDHHCFFADCCVGYHNQRYFILFCLYGGLGTLLSAVTMSYYLDQHYAQLKTLGYVSYLPPVILYSWMHNNSVSSFIFAMLIFQYLSVVTTVFCFYLCVTQLYLACAGLTAYEYKKSIHTYRATLWKNILSVFGNYWFVGLVFPAPCFGYVSDGIYWNNSLNSKLL